MAQNLLTVKGDIRHPSTYHSYRSVISMTDTFLCPSRLLLLVKVAFCRKIRFSRVPPATAAQKIATPVNRVLSMWRHHIRNTQHNHQRGDDITESSRHCPVSPGPPVISFPTPSLAVGSLRKRAVYFPVIPAEVILILNDETPNERSFLSRPAATASCRRLPSSATRPRRRRRGPRASAWLRRRQHDAAWP